MKKKKLLIYLIKKIEDEIFRKHVIIYERQIALSLHV